MDTNIMGEPMLHPKAVELMEYAKKVGAKVGLITNGSKFTEKNSMRLLEAKVDMIEFSADAADPETYVKVRKGLSWRILLRNIKRMVQWRNKLKSPSKIIASGVNQVDVDIETVERFWAPFVDNFQKRKYLTWGITDPSKSADPTPYLPPEQYIPCPFIFERLNIDSKETLWYVVLTLPLKQIWGISMRNLLKKYGMERVLNTTGGCILNGGTTEIELCQNCPDWKYRSWQHNYWKIIKNAERRRRERFSELSFQDMEGCISDSSGKLKTRNQ